MRQQLAGILGTDFVAGRALMVVVAVHTPGRALHGMPMASSGRTLQAMEPWVLGCREMKCLLVTTVCGCSFCPDRDNWGNLMPSGLCTSMLYGAERPLCGGCVPILLLLAPGADCSSAWPQAERRTMHL